MNWMMLLMALAQQAGPNLMKILPDLKVIAEALGRILVVIKGTTNPPLTFTSSRQSSEFLRLAQEQGVQAQDAEQVLAKFEAASAHLPTQVA